MRWRWWRPEPAPPRRAEPPDPAAAIVEECTAFLHGAYPAWLAAHGLAVPPWAWLNPVAHATPTQLAALAAGRAEPNDAEPPKPMSWADVTTVLAAELVDVDDLAERQRESLVPLELRLAAGAPRVGTPEALLEAAHAALQESFGE
jgi:hypothetical protein